MMNAGSMEQGAGSIDSTRSTLAAVVTIALLASVILYPENFLKGYELQSGLRISPLIVTMLVSMPALVLILWRSRHELRPGIADVALIITMAYIVIRGTVSASGSLSLIGLVLLYTVSGLAVYYCSMVFAGDRVLVRVVIAAVMGMMLFIILYALLEFIARENFFYESGLSEVMPQEGDFYRPRSTVGQPIILGALSVGALPLAWMQYRFPLLTWERSIGKVSLLVLPIGVILSFSRGSWLLLAGVTMLFVARKAGFMRSYRAVYIWALAISIIMILAVVLLHNADPGFIGRSGSLWTRGWAWEGALRTFINNPVFGVGPFRGPGNITNDWGYNGIFVTAVDNYYLTVLVEVGIVGVLLAGATFALMVLSSIKVRYTGILDVVGPESLIVFSLLIGLIGALVFDAYMLLPTYFLFWCELGILRGARSSGSLNPPGVKKEEVMTAAGGVTS